MLDVGQCEGTLSDGRPYAAELWAQDQATFLTMFFPRAEGEGLNDDSAADLIEREGLAKLGRKRAYCAIKPFDDDAGNPVWSLNLVVGDDDETYVVEDQFKFHPYPGQRRPSGEAQ